MFRFYYLQTEVSSYGRDSSKNPILHSAQKAFLLPGIDIRLFPKYRFSQ